MMQKIRMKAVVNKSSPYTCIIQLKTAKSLMQILIIIEKSVILLLENRIRAISMKGVPK